MNETKLLRCPCCKGESILYGTSDALCKYFICYCTKCGLTQPKKYRNKKEAIKAWNTRNPMQNIVERIEAEKSNLTTWAEDMAFKIGIEKAIAIVKEEGEL